MELLVPEDRRHVLEELATDLVDGASRLELLPFRLGRKRRILRL